MNRQSILISIAVVAALVVPTGAATWYSAGTFEPDTTFDKTDGRMWLDPDTNATGKRVYFNVYEAEYVTSYNPNVGALPTGGTRVALTPIVHFQALLGIWKDCNGDGYIGRAEGALREYRSELLLVDGVAGICSAVPAGVNDPPVHNDGQWVSELLVIGAVDPCEFKDTTTRGQQCGGIGAFFKNPVVLYSNDTMIWGDSGLPTSRGGGTCAINPPPQGTTAGTGYMISYADCFTGRQIANNWNNVVNNVDPSLAFEDPNTPQKSTSPVNQHFPVNLWGNPETGKTGLIEDGQEDPSFTTWDCNSGTATSVRDPTAPAGSSGQLRHVAVPAPAGTPSALTIDNGELAYVNLTDDEGTILAVYSPNPSLQDPTASYNDAVEYAADGVYTKGGIGVGGVGRVFLGERDLSGDCDPATKNSAEQTFPQLEGSSGGDSTPAKAQTTTYFTFFDGGRGVVDDETDEQFALQRTPLDGGLGYNRRIFVGPTWGGHTNFVRDPQLISRATLQPQGATYFTWYATLNGTDISSFGWQLPSTTTGVYGEEACGADAGVVGAQPANGWACDPDVWWTNSAGKSTMPYSSACGDFNTKDGNADDECRAQGGVPLAPRVGADYHLRDIDCLDGHVAAQTVYASLAPISTAGTCP